MILRIIVLVSFLILSVLPSYAEEHKDASFDLSSVVIHHLKDKAEFPINVGGRKVFEGDKDFDPQVKSIFEDHHTHKKYHFVGGYDLHITKRVTMMWIVSFFLMLTFISAARIIAKNPYRVQSRFAGLVESFIQFLKNDVIDPNMHGHGHPYYHYLFSLFFFILFCNLFGIIPPVGEVIAWVGGMDAHHSLPVQIWSGITATGDVSVTVALAILTFILIYATGFVYQGIKFIINVVPTGVPLAMYPLLWPLEFIVSPLAKSFSLTVRLLANMTAGHVIILALMGFIFQFQSYKVVPVSILSSAAIYLLEIFVAFLQAYIFTLLTAIFVGSSMHKH
ncbi:MAG: F0F1 ATP synthase subunit A [Leptospiraceae bacterium]|nr:F0F1 ATP synthase subunit A [Leptospiraceae bacterium]